jgi:hypothetical protein
MSTFIAEHPLAGSICILLVTAAFFLLIVIAVSSVQPSPRIGDKEPRA